ncbi:hypothetical protein [Streptomyces sp. NPDC057686]|uniref:hypothetical protein n=1 Tax=Streptomyces sp. NPDC057686 TaxID=3346212 RepID=UPI0036C1158F
MITPGPTVLIGGPVTISLARLLRWATRNNAAYPNISWTVRTEIETIIEEFETIGQRCLTDGTKANLDARRRLDKLCNTGHLLRRDPTTTQGPAVYYLNGH